MALTYEQAIYRLIVGPSRYTLGTEGRDIKRMIADIERAVGGKSYSDAARALGVPRTTWRNWRRGAKPKPAAFELLRAAQRRARLSRAREAFLRGDPAVRVYGWVRVSKDIRLRVLRVSTYSAWVRPMPDVLDAWLAMDDARAVELFNAPIEREIGGVHFDELIDIRAFKTESLADHWSEGL